MISEKFKNIPIEEDTKILSRKEIKIGDYDAIHEVWTWEGIHAEGYIFFNEDINDLNEEGVWLLVDKSIGEDKATIKKPMSTPLSTLITQRHIETGSILFKERKK